MKALRSILRIPEVQVSKIPTRLVSQADTARDERRWAEAAQLYRTALEDDSTLPPEIHVQAGHAFKESGEFVLAEHHYRTAVASGKRDPDFYIQLGHLLKITGRTAEAWAAYEESLSIDPAFAPAQQEIGVLLPDGSVGDGASGYGWDFARPGESHSGVVTLKGWLVGSAPVASLRLMADGRLLCEMSHGLGRPDTAARLPDVSHAARAGIEAQFDSCLLPDGSHSLTLAAVFVDGTKARIPLQLLVENRLERRGAVLLRLERYRLDQENLLDAGNLFLRGELLSPKKIAGLTAMLNDTKVRSLELSLQNALPGSAFHRYAWSIESPVPRVLGESVSCTLDVRLFDGPSETFTVRFKRISTGVRTNVASIPIVPAAPPRLNQVSLAVRVPERICVLKLDHIGDFMMALPAFSSLRIAFPSAEITLICGPWAVEMAGSTGLFDAVHGFGFFAEASGEVARNSSSAMRSLRTLHDFGRLIATTCRKRFDLALDLRHDPDTRPLLSAIPADVTAGFGTTREFPFLHISLAMTHTEQPDVRRGPSVLGRDQLIAASALTPIAGFRRSHTALIAEPDPEWAPIFICSSDAAQAGEDKRHLSFGVVNLPAERSEAMIDGVYGFEERESWGVWANSRLAIARVKRPARGDENIDLVLKSPTLPAATEREVSVFTALGRERTVSFTRSHQRTTVALDAADFASGWQHGFITQTLELVPGDWSIRIRVHCRGDLAPDLAFWGLWLGPDGGAEQSFAWTAQDIVHGQLCELTFPLTASPGRMRGAFLFIVEGTIPAGHLEVAGLRLERNASWLARERTHQSTLDHALVDSVISHFVRSRDLRGLVKAEQPAAAREIAALRDAGNKAIVVAPGCNAEVRKWPVGHWAELCALILTELPDALIFIVGGPDDRIECAHLEDLLGSDRVRNMCGDFSLQQLPAVLQEADLFIGNNTGTTHVAAAMGVRVLAIYSGTNQVREWGPLGRNGTALFADLPCAPCHIGRPSECPYDLECLTSINPTRVMNSVRTSFHRLA